MVEYIIMLNLLRLKTKIVNIGIEMQICSYNKVKYSLGI
jgi:hypothetical protein